MGPKVRAQLVTMQNVLSRTLQGSFNQDPMMINLVECEMTANDTSGSSPDNVLESMQDDLLKGKAMIKLFP
jgi:hypothetical protein